MPVLVVLLIEAVVFGILSGAIYALMASGLTLIFGVLKIINLAQGIFVIAGAYLCYAFQQRLHLDPFLGLILSLPVLFFLGVGIEWVFIRKLTRDRVMFSILVTFAIALILEGVLTFLFSTDYVQLHTWSTEVSVNVGGFYVTYFSLLSFLFSIVLLSGLFVLVYRTQFGANLRASIQNPTAATLVGINVERVQALTFGVGVALAGAGGMAYGATTLFNPGTSYDLIYRLLVIVVLGGLGSLRGALIGSVVMLVLVDVIAVWSPVWSSIAFFLFFLVLVRVRPQGLFGLLEGRKQ